MLVNISVESTRSFSRCIFNDGSVGVCLAGVTMVTCTYPFPSRYCNSHSEIDLLCMTSGGKGLDYCSGVKLQISESEVLSSLLIILKQKFMEC